VRTPGSSIKSTSSDAVVVDVYLSEWEPFLRSNGRSPDTTTQTNDLEGRVGRVGP
jgi:hypothetical protein